MHITSFSRLHRLVVSLLFIQLLSLLSFQIAPGIMVPSKVAALEGFAVSLLQPAMAHAAPPHVVCVPSVPSDLLIPHETWQGEPTILKGVVHNLTAGTYYWEYGDGNSSEVREVTDPYNLSVVHEYVAEPGTLFIARLHVINEEGDEATDDYRVEVKAKTQDVEINKAIDDGLWWLFTHYEEVYNIIPSTAFSTPDGEEGLLGQYFNNTSLTGEPVLERVDPNIDFNWGRSPGEGVNNDFSVRWTGTINIPESGIYYFASNNDDGTRLFIDGITLINDWRSHGPTWIYSEGIYLEKGSHTFRVDFYDGCCGAQAKIYWKNKKKVKWRNTNPDNRYTEHVGNPTASALQAFEINGHLETGDPAEDPYAEIVQKGMAYLLDNLQTYNIDVQNGNDPDTNHNGIGLTWPGARPVYELGAIMDAMVATGTPDAIAKTGGVNVLGRRYQDIVQDMVDMYAWGQDDAGSDRGGWRYSWNAGSDNSASQWAAIGMIAAERHFGCTVPQWVKDNTDSWLNHSFNGNEFGYTGPGTGWATTPSGLVQLSFAGKDITDPRWVAAESTMASHWTNGRDWFIDAGRSRNRYYSYYAFAKAMRLALPNEITHLSTGLNWYGDEQYGLARALVDAQNDDGSWPYDGWPYVGERTAAAWNVIILTRTLFEKPPVAVIKAEPNPGAVGQTIEFDASGSYHTDAAKEIVQYLWDFDNSDGVDFDHPDATGVNATFSYGSLKDYTVSLKVIDNSTPPRFDISTYTIHITVPPHPPTAVIGGPYIAATGEPVQVDGSGSYDIDEAQGDSITAWEWESDMVPPYGFDEAEGEKAILPPFLQPGRYDIILRVTDNTAEAFPSSNQPNLTDTDYGEVTVYAVDVTDLSARAKDAKCQLTWTPTEAEAYRILRSEKGPNEGFVQIGSSTSDYAVFIDHNLATSPGETVNACSGDFNGDYVVDEIDAALFAQELGSSDCSDARPCRGDFDGDGDVDGTDNAFLMAEMGRTQCLQVTGIELNRDYWYRIMTEVDGITYISNPAHVNSQGKVEDHPPVITSTPLLAAVEAEPYQYDVDAYDPEGTSLEYLLDIAPAGMSIDSGSGLITWTPAMNQAGTHDVMVLVRDEAGITATQFFQVVVTPRENSAPVPNPGGPYSGLTGQQITFSATASDPEGDPIVSWHWAFGDGTEAQGQQVVHTYSAPGTYTVSLFVTDNRGATGHAETSCQIDTPNRPPVADAGGPYSGFAGSPVTFDASGSYDPDDDPMTYTWNFGDSTPAETGMQVSHTYLEAGTYTATLSVDDGRGGLDTVSVKVTISPPNQPPEAIFDVQGELIKWATITFDASASIDPDGHDITAYQWDFGDGKGTTGTIVSHAYAEPGNYTVTLTVTDSFGLSGTASRVLEIVHPPNNSPVIDAGGPYSGPIGESIVLSAQGADPDGDNITWTWECNGNTYEGREIAVVFDDAGTFTATVHADDGYGGVSSDTAVIDVYDPDAPVDEVPPHVAITSPELGKQLSGTVRFYGTVSDENLVSWRFEYALSGTEKWHELATGDSELDNGLIAEVDTRLWSDNTYRFRLVANDGRQSASHWNEYIVINPVQLGRFSISYTDLAIPVMGMDLKLVRSYDTRYQWQGDFGNGWRLDMKNVALMESDNHNVFITLPDGRRVAFAFTPVLISQWFPMYEAKFTAPPGVFDELDFVGNHTVVYSGGQWYYFMDSQGLFNPSEYILKTRDGLTYHIRDDFGVTRVENRHGNWVNISTSGITTSTGRNVVFDYNAEGLISTITDPAGGMLHYEYDGEGNLISFKDQAGNETRYVYDSAGHLKEIITPDGTTPLTVEYDADGRVSSRIDAHGNRTTYEYDLENLKETIIKPNGHRVTYTYDANGHEIQRDDSLTGVTVSVRDADGNLLEEITPEGRRRVFTYDSRGAKLSETLYADPGDNSTAHTRLYTYDEFGNPLSVTMEDGSRTELSYDADFNLVSRIRRDSAGNLISEESWTYDQHGNKLTYTDASGHVTKYTYNAFGDMLSKTDPSGVTENYEYDALGHRTAIINAFNQRIEMDYDPLGNLKSVRRNGTTVYTLTTNQDGRITSFSHEYGSARFKWSSMGKIDESIDEAGSRLTPSYDEALNMTSLVYEDANGTNGFETYYDYDSRGRQKSRTDQLGNITSFFYDNDDYFTGKALPDGSTIIYERDGMGRVVKETAPEGVTEYSYDRGSRLTQAVSRHDGVNATVEISYNSAGLIESIIDAAGRRVAYGYDESNRRITMTAPDGTPDGIIAEYSYDQAGRLKRIDAGGAWVAFGYDAAGRRISAETSGGAVTSYGYNSDGLLSSVALRDASGTIVSSFAYTYDSLGNRIAAETHDGSIAWTYDSLGRLTSEVIDSSTLGEISQGFSYDWAGNRYTDSMAERYNIDNSLASVGPVEYSYDAQGNMLTYTGGPLFSYDSRKRLASYAFNGTNATYEYDFLGRRIKKTVNGEVTEYLYDNENLLAMYRAGSPVAIFIHGTMPDEPLMTIQNGSVYFYHADGHGSIIAITDSHGNMVQRYSYDAWGRILLNEGAFSFDGSSGLVNTFTYTGREYDSESGLYHYRSRAYNPAIGRFLQRDGRQGSLIQPQSLNLYAYCRNNPVNFIDPSGQIVTLTYASILSIPSGREVAAALAGFLQGYSITNISFLGNYMALIGTGRAQGLWWLTAYNMTKRDMTITKLLLGGGSYLASKVPLPDVAAIPGAFKGGVTFSVGFSLTLKAERDNISGEYKREFKAEVSGGGFENGVEQALDFIWQCRPR